MDFATEFLRGFYELNGLFIVGCCVVFWVRRYVWKRRKRLGRGRLGFFPTYASAGNSLQSLQSIAEHRVEYVIEEKIDDEAADEDDLADPMMQLHRQLRQIRRGDKVERLTIRHF